MADFLKVNDIINELHTQETMTGAEFGCGSAQFALALARKLKKGKVYALDIQEEKLSALKGRLSVEKAHNVYPILCNLEAPRGSTLPNNSLDIVLIPNLLFQAEHRHVILEEAARITKPKGHIAVVDWLEGSTFGPKGTSLVTPDEVKKLGTTAHLHFTKEFAAGDYHYAIIFTK